MLTLVIGGSASGKSEYAEQLVCETKKEKRIYIATMQPIDTECKKRIEKHRQMRKSKGFETIECYTSLEKCDIPFDSVVLLECMSNLVANELFSPNGAHENTVRTVLDGISLFCKQASDVIIVSNEIFQDGVQYDEYSNQYLKMLGQINQKIAQYADRVVEMVYTIPIVHKKERRHIR